LRSEKKALEKIDQDIEELDEDAARKAYRRFELEYTAQRQRQTDMQGEVRLLSPSPLPFRGKCWRLVGEQQARLGGEIGALKADEKEKNEELNSEYKNIEERYRRELINVKVRYPSFLPSPSDEADSQGDV
jgi:DNA repair protein RAD50